MNWIQVIEVVDIPIAAILFYCMYRKWRSEITHIFEERAKLDRDRFEEIKRLICKGGSR